MSPTPGRSILITSAPIQASSCVQVGPDCTCVKSRMRTPSSALPACPNGLAEGFGSPLPFFLATSFTIFFDFAAAFFVAFFAGFAALFFALAMGPSGLLLLQLALRIEIADAAGFAAGSRIEHRVDQSRTP